MGRCTNVYQDKRLVPSSLLLVKPLSLFSYFFVLMRDCWSMHPSCDTYAMEPSLHLSGLTTVLDSSSDTFNPLKMCY